MKDDSKIRQCLSWIAAQPETSEVQQMMTYFNGLPCCWVSEDCFCNFSQADDVVRIALRQLAIACGSQNKELLDDGKADQEGRDDALQIFDRESRREGAPNGLRQVESFIKIAHSCVCHLVEDGPAGDQETALLVLLDCWNVLCQLKAKRVAGVGFG